MFNFLLCSLISVLIVTCFKETQPYLQGAFKGLTMFGEAMVHSVTGSKPAQSPKKQELAPPDENGYRPGIVSVVDLKTVSTDHVRTMF